MLSYQHAYHAGNFADVHKHLTLYAVQQHMLRKKTPVTFIDTHAGRGLYPLAAEETRRLDEYRQGVLPLWQQRARLTADPLLAAWLAAVSRAQEAEGRLSHYPGSPWWLIEALREADRALLFELHPGEHDHLAELPLPPGARRLHGDGLSGLVQRLPVVTPRLCVLIDPSYERKTEYREVAETVLAVMRKVRHAVVLVWYPLLPAARHLELLEGIRDGGLRKVWRSELTLREPDEQRGMFGSGMLVVNPPWGLDEALAAAMVHIAPLLGDACRYRADWWVEE
ncbi:23S rRNA (adenine(2030)-N(6))-methyltransferase RlmJ [Halomonas campisalis]|uniref:Ribosomal RNA large subunit methyltransferase J n=1 Tax=Billgrantia campisalis TaxID=74661 RepID=A0ABS9P4M0_9GAMM|nr:23S rRNA (adenine(2030)-N(6))-methyltransferase RlmJ [Halomonas campisalis]MCG6656694.1 23S rRNA (adenine(2030)-N(6))-methyltransferase RlmJ [Halomonas campisalis]MDR5861883.1 23S rRNA (adenine(2030)-N(6))-methyltransferase RlmJ [Halomonas campisalis]